VPISSKLPFTAFLCYSPRGKGHISAYSKTLTIAIKNNSSIPVMGKREFAIPYTVRRLHEERPRYEALTRCFPKNAVAVPMPRSAPLVPNALWPTMLICEEMAKQGVVTGVQPLLKRTAAVLKSATAPPGQRPTPQQHYDSLAVDTTLIPASSHLVIVDDVITKGSTALAAHARISEAFPFVSTHFFALVRTMRQEIEALKDPVCGSITLGFYGPMREP
jgi:hypothetical protein